MTGTPDADDGIVSRRRFLRVSTAAGVLTLAGCNSQSGTETATEDGSTDDGTGGDTTEVSAGDQPPWYGSGPGAFEQRPVPGGTSMDDMPDMSGTLNIYSGRGEGLVGDLLGYLESRYPDLTLRTTYDSAARLANRIDTEGSNTPADVFYSVNAGALGFLAENGHTQQLADGTTSLVAQQFRANDGSWSGTSGRARTIPFNTNTLSESDIPDAVMAFPDRMSQYSGAIGWAPTYSSFQGFVTAMRILEGEDATRQWLRGMQELNVQTYPDEFAVSRAVADGELAFGFANHYYIQRVLAGRPDAPISTGFTGSDAGSIFNVAGAARLGASDSGELADLFVRHLLSSEAQEYFAVRTFEYPLVEGVEPVGRLPAIEELSVPNIDLSQLSDIGPTIDLLRDEGVL
jgi:iron(III) transport system substrate-binding protein